ncbi:hypothetical protein JCGZ_09339 [Jatropha curcas]|uniref:Uncharacterized protein n=1 Tax=Jatropha curcas TaxID=180498 RepID=A0A067KXB2_JATCU|nr:hypothetical protein JCGZ_09339 [Jatropha curcas]
MPGNCIQLLLALPLMPGPEPIEMEAPPAPQEPIQMHPDNEAHYILLDTKRAQNDTMILFQGIDACSAHVANRLVEMGCFTMKDAKPYQSS